MTAADRVPSRGVPREHDYTLAQRFVIDGLVSYQPPGTAIEATSIDGATSLHRCPSQRTAVAARRSDAPGERRVHVAWRARSASRSAVR